MKGNKHGFRRVLAVLLSAMLMVSNLGLTAFAEELTSEPVDAYADEEVFSSYAEAPSQDVDILLDDGTCEETQIIDEGSLDLFTDGTDDVYQQDAVLTEDPMVDDGSQDDPLGIFIEEMPDEGDAQFLEPVPTLQEYTVHDRVITVTADAGVFPSDAALYVDCIENAAITQAAENALGISAGDNVLVRHVLYSFSGTELYGSAKVKIAPVGYAALCEEYPDAGIAFYMMRWNGDYQEAWMLPADFDAEKDQVEFELSDLTVYDLLAVVQLPEEDQPQDAAEGTPGEQTEEVIIQPDEIPMEEPAGQPADDSMGDPIAEAQPVSVVFDAVPETALVTVYPAATEEAPDPEAIPAQEDGSFLLLPGEYAYSAQAEGYVPVEAVPFTVTDDEQPMLISFEMEAVAEEIPEPVAFDQSRTVNGVVVTVKADPGVFPADAVLSVETVPVYQQQQADAAVDEVRGENQNVAVSYTFDIKVIHPETGEEYQPAEGQTVSVSFALAEVVDENLETQVYHVTEDETTGELAAESLDVNTEITPETGEATTAVVETDGFSIYTVEFTYNNLEYVLPGSTSVPMSEILTAVGLTGEVTAVEVSDASLFSASDETGEWIVAAHQAFSTTEWMKVTINGVVYEITVTDDGEITTWAALVDAFHNGGDVSLGGDIAASFGDPGLKIQDDKDVTLYLNGFTISADKNVAAGIENLIEVDNGSLTIEGSGTISYTNGHYTILVRDNGEAIMNGGLITSNSCWCTVSCDHGSFTINNGEIASTNSSQYHSTVYDYGKFIMNGGKVSGDPGISLYFYSSLSLSGSIDINSIYLVTNWPEDKITFGEKPLSITAPIVVSIDTLRPTAGNPRVITSGFSGKGTAANFTSADSAYAVRTNADGEAQLMLLQNVSVDESITNGTVTVNPDTVKACEGDTVTVTVESAAGYELGALNYTNETDHTTTEIPPNGDGSYTFTMPAADVTVHASFDNGWSVLRARMASGEQNIILDADYTAGAENWPLEVPAGVSVTLDLNGKTIDRGLTNEDAQENGYVIINNGTLTITDSSSDGKIKGGKNIDQGGGIVNNGTLTMTGGSITGNIATGSGDGGGIYNSGTLNMTGGTITGNSANGSGGGVYNNGTLNMTGGSITLNAATDCGGGILQNGTMNVSGNPVVSNNTADNIYLSENKLLTVTGGFTDGASLYVAKSGGTGQITSGYGYESCNHSLPSYYFHADGGDEYKIALKDNEAIVTNDSSVNRRSYVERSWTDGAVVSVLKETDAYNLVPSGYVYGGIYYVDKDSNFDGIIWFNDDTDLILGNGKTLTLKGIHIASYATLNIYPETEDGTGKIVIIPSTSYAGIGGGKVVIHGGVIQTHGGDGGAGIGGGHQGAADLVIYAGTVTATGGANGAGIGGGSNGSGGNITIYGGTVTATGGLDGAGIGGGNHGTGGTINIYGGNITANGPTDSDCNENGAGIGGGRYGSGGTITINGGTITTYSRDGAGIGGGDDGDGGNITINGGTITSIKVNQGQGARIGGGSDAAPGTIVINGGTITTDGGSGAGIGGGKGNKSGGTVTINGGVINASGSYGIGAGKSGADVAITLGYTDATKDSISVTASSYGGTVTLSQSFAKYTGSDGQNLANIFLTGVVSDNSLLASGTLKAWDGKIANWQMLQKAIIDAPNGATIMLDQDISAIYQQDTALQVGSGKNLTIDLNGHTLDRGLTNYAAQSAGYVIKNEGTLTITDSAGGGIITGGNSSNAGGGIYNAGTLTINGGTISGNTSSKWGGGIHLDQDAVLNLNGGVITNNTCSSDNNGGGIHVSERAHLNVSGNPQVSENKKGATVNNVNLASSAVIHVTETLADTASLGVSVSQVPTAGSPRVITDGLSGKGEASNFVSDNGNYALGVTAGGEAYLGEPVTITFAKGDESASGTMEDVKVATGSVYTLPECEFIPSLGKAFTGWLVDDDTTSKLAGDTITVTADTTMTAVWEDATPAQYTVTFDPDNGDDTTQQTVVSGKTAEKPEDPTKEGFTFDGWYQVTDADAGTLAEEAFDFEKTAISEDITLKAVWQSDLKLAVYSTDTKFGGSVANVTVSPVKTGYKTGESVTVTAEEKQGYSFLGWYAVTGVNDSQVTGYGDKLAETLAYTFDITKDTQITAVYEAKGKATVKIIAVNGAKYMVGDDTTIKTGSQENVPIGTTLKLTAADADQVFQWQNESEKILGTGSTLEYYVTSNTTITLVYQYDAENQSYVQFVSDYGQVLSYNQYSVSSTIDFPVSPTKYGYTFDKWVFEGTEDEAAAETIKAKIGTEKIITLKPKYTKDEAVGSVTVNYKAGNTVIADASTTADIPVGNTKTFTAQDIDGYTFECWKSEDGTVLGYKKDYFMQVTGEHVLNACYVTEGGEVEEAKPTIVIGELEKVTSGSTHKVRGSVTRSIPEGYTLIEHGILYARDKSGLNEDTFVYSDGTDGIIKRISTATMMNGVVSLNVKVDSDDVVVSFRGYMILKNSSTGEQTYYYTAIKEGSYQSIQ